MTDETRSLADARPAARVASLLVCEPERAVRSFALPGDGALVIGRGADCELVLADDAASRRHARLELDAAGARIVDLGSHNGVLVNGARVAGAQALAARDLIAIGRTTLVYHPVAVTAVATARAAAVAPSRATAEIVAVGERRVVVGDPRMRAIYDRVRQLAPQPLTVVIAGETGTGKELIARALHAWSPRADEPFVALNCAALPESLAESELFGYEKGAFSGALAARPGVLEAAGRGTLFLDEIAELSLANQGRLLRALDLRRVTRLGSVQERPLALRLVAATNRDLEAEVRAGRFRSDLFFRLGGATIELPPLRERLGELAALADTLLAAACAALDRPARRFADDAHAALAAHDWPGNVRELGHVVELVAAGLGGDAPVARAELPPKLRATHGSGVGGWVRNQEEPAPALAPPSTRRAVDEELRALERARMVEALAQTGGNQTRAAALIGMPRRTFVAKLRQYGIRSA